MSNAEPSIQTPDERPTNVRWMMFALSCLTSWFLYLHRYTWNLIVPELKAEYEFTNTQIGALGSFFNISYGSLQIPSGILSDLIGPHFCLGLIIVLWSLVLPSYGLFGSFKGLAASRFVFGAAQAGTYSNLAKVTHAWFPPASRTSVQGWVATFFGRGGGAMSSIIMATLLMGYCGLSWRMALVVMGGVGVLFGIVFLLLFRNSPAVDRRVNPAELELIAEGRLPTTDSSPRILPWRVVLKNRSMLFFVIQQIMSAGADMVYSLFMGDFFLNTKGFSIGMTGWLLSLPLFGGAIGGTLGGYLNDWLIRSTGNIRRARTIVGFTGKFLAGLLMLVVISVDNGIAAGCALFAVKFFSDWSQPTVWGACTDLGGRYSATVFSIINTAGTIGGVICPPVFGWILDSNTIEVIVDGAGKKVADYNPLFMVIAAMYLVSAASWFFIDSTDSLDREAA